jgi:hypothetical protein
MTARAGMEPIRVVCEGAGCSPIRTTIDPATFSYTGGIYVGLCSMCGQWIVVTDEGMVGEHRRDDVLAMIERGDFG